MFFTIFDKTSATADMKVSNVFRALIKVTFDYLMASVISFQNISRVYIRGAGEFWSMFAGGWAF